MSVQSLHRNTGPSSPDADPELITVTVSGLAVPDTDQYRLAGQARPARRAVSCLVVPQEGDQVLAVVTMAGPIILAVLTRAVPVGAQLSVPDAPSVTVAARSLTLDAETNLVARAADFEMTARTIRVDTEEANLFGRAASLVTTSLRVIADLVQTTAQNLVTQATHSVRVVDELDTVSAGSIVIRAKATHSLQAAQVLMSATGDVRVDAETVSFG